MLLATGKPGAAAAVDGWAAEVGAPAVVETTGWADCDRGWCCP